MEEQALIPVAQTDITIASFPFTFILLPDDQTGAVFSMFCQALDLDQRHQLERLHRDPEMTDAFVLVALETRGGLQPTNVIYSWALALWLASIRAGARLPTYRDRLHIIRRKAFRALAKSNLFKQNAPARPADPITQAPPPPAALPTPSEDAKHTAVAPFPLSALGAWAINQEERLAALEAAKQEQGSELAVLKHDHHINSLRLAALESSHARPTVGLSPQRITHLVLLARQLRQQRGIPMDDTFAALAARFQAPNAFDLPDAAWSAILIWFEGLLAG